MIETLRVIYWTIHIKHIKHIHVIKNLSINILYPAFLKLNKTPIKIVCKIFLSFFPQKYFK